MNKKIELNIFGMTCASCALIIQKELDGDKRIKKSNVDIINNRALIEFDEKEISSVEIIEIIKKAGYDAKILDAKEDFSSVIIKKTKLRFWWSFALALPLFYLSMGEMFGFPSIEISLISNFSWQLVLTFIIVLINRKIYFSGFSKLVKLRPNMDSLIAIGTATAFLYSVFVYLKIILNIDSAMMSHVYFESAGIILLFIALGKYLEEKTKGKTGNAIKKLIGLQAKTALVIRNDKEIELSISDVVKGDIVVVKAGDKVPVDGKIVFGESTIDESSITGESIPTFKKVGDQVIGGTINKTGLLRFEALGVGEDTMLAQIIKIMREAMASKASIQLLVDKVSYYFVPIVMAIAIIAFVVWYLLGFDSYFALTAFVSVLIIACPCSLGLATPTAVMMGTGLAAKKGILIKSSAALEIASKVQVVVFDKTGTLTKGSPEVVEVINFNFPKDKVVKVASSLAKNSKHPLSKAVFSYAQKEKIEQVALEKFEEIEGLGLRASCQQHQTALMLGNKRFLDRENINISPEVEREYSNLSQAGKTTLFIVHGTMVMGLIGIIDDVKDEALDLIKELKKRKKEIYMITGDNDRVATTIAEKIGIDNFFANVLPADKAKKVKELQDKGLVVAMVGDGINDAPALAQADLGIAMASGTDIAIEAGEVVLVKNNLWDLISLIDVSAYTFRKVKQNLFWAFVYNVLGIPVAAGVFYSVFGVLLNPMIAAIAMSLSSVSVVSNSLVMRFYRFKR
jgi:P-type Cu+ transporter